jgi:hypothetical protein
MVTALARPWATAKFDDAQPGARLVIVMFLAETPPLGMVTGQEPGLVKVRSSGWLVPGYSGVARFPPTVKRGAAGMTGQQGLVTGPGCQAQPAA